MIYERSSTECQPCDNFDGREGFYGLAEHECYSPGCEGGRVAFCNNCHTDHHRNGYGTCGGKWHFPCRYQHKQCAGEEVPGIGDS